MTFRFHFIASVGALAVLGLPSTAEAEPSAADRALATLLFKEGRALVDQGRVADGCRKLEESQRLDPGGGTLLNVALCHEKEGRTATAWAELTEALGIAKKDDRPQRVELAQSHIAALEPTLSRLVINVPESADLPDLEIKRDGSVIRRAAWGTAMPVDPGEHVIEAGGFGKIPWKQSVTVGARSDSKTVTVPPLEKIPTPTNVASPNTDSTSTHPSAERATGSRAAAWVAMGFGAVGMGVGSYFGVKALADKKTGDDGCPNDVCTSQAAHDANDSAIKAANFSTVGFGVGIVGIGLGAVLLLTNGPSHAGTAAPLRAGANVGPTGSELTLSGRF
ncbi:MAG TPA: hypothetical protein VJT73_09870 [Polyangiaceae bacterium]|nr:hypothetical protein [Polyangiaceae bacterium]